MQLYLEYWFTFFFIFPILEWILHYILHIFNNKTHIRHHDIVTNNRIDTKNKLSIEYWPILPIVICLYYTFFIGALFFLKYYIIHTLIHWYPNIIPELSSHHKNHHIYSKYNFCVTNIWPDILLGTQYTKKIN